MRGGGSLLGDKSPKSLVILLTPSLRDRTNEKSAVQKTLSFKKRLLYNPLQFHSDVHWKTVGNYITVFKKRPAS